MSATSTPPNGVVSHSNKANGIMETNFLIVGAGPAGASLACFLARQKLTGILLSSAAGPAFTPRAHIANMPALECLRDLDAGVYDECLRLGNGNNFIEHYRWCETMAGEEYGRQRAWGFNRKSEYEAASPCPYLDLPQSKMEPSLLKYASNRGWAVRFDTQLASFVDEAEGKLGVTSGRERKIVATVADQVSGLEYQIRTKYLFGADGGRSTIAKQLELPFTVLPGGGFAYNVYLRADLVHLMKYRQGNLHLAMSLEKNFPFIAALRMVQPWTEWVFVFLPKGPDVPNPKRSHEEWKEICLEVIGEKNVDIDILDVSGWAINETSADVISKGNVYCLGDAIHRHPPTLGLGSNTCIQDAFNLAWKIDLVHRGLAAPSLLDTYNTERQPVASHLVTESNNILRYDLNLFASLGLQPYNAPDADRIAAKHLLSENTPSGRAQRKAMSQAMRGLQRELHALGTAMAQRYESTAVVGKDEVPYQPGPKELENPHENYEPSTYPGRRLPHAWLGTGDRIPGPYVSTLDVSGKGQFTLLTGIGGEGWKSASREAEDKFGVVVKVVNIGIGLDYADVYLDWEALRGVEEDGCVLVRPDNFVAWRAQESGDEVERLGKVMGSILGRTETKAANGNGSLVSGLAKN